MVEFDLYLDESGKFEDPGEHTLIGGFLINHAKKLSNQDFDNWEKELKSNLANQGIYTTGEIANGDEWHDLHVQGGKNGRLSANLAARYTELTSQPHYVFDHCSENKPGVKRWKAEVWVLKEYIKKLQMFGGYPVIFDNPQGQYHIDSNSTFLSIFANGIIRLYNDLKIENPKDNVILNIHAASRWNVTKAKQQSLYAISPVPGIGANLNMELYKNQIKNCVFLNGGYSLLQIREFNDSLNSFTILNDTIVGNKKLPNPATIVCDYICNGFYQVSKKKDFQKVFNGANTKIYDVFSGPMSSVNYDADLIKQNHQWGYFLAELVSCKFPQAKTQDFFDEMEKDKNFDQYICVNTLVDLLRPYIRGRENMIDWVERIQLIIDRTTPFIEEVYRYLKANMLIYLNALYTHMGKADDVKRVANDFVRCTWEIQDVKQRDSLLVLYCNRQIVTTTDSFMFTTGEKYFRILQRYCDASIKNSEDLLMDFVEIEKTDLSPNTVMVEYGRDIGSYIQLITKHLRVARGKERVDLEDEANKLISLATKHFTSRRDMDRAHQNLCDLFVELGKYADALDQLCMVVSVKQRNTEKEKAMDILDAIGHYGENKKFEYLHYVSMMHRSIRCNNALGDILVDCVLSDPPDKERIDKLVNLAHPDALICWHLAASLAERSKYRTLAKELFERAWHNLANQEDILKTIGIATRMEEIALGLEGKLPGKYENWENERKVFVKNEYPDYCKNVMMNPFKNEVSKKGFSFSREELYTLADMIAY